jgi:hypothetical protein
MPKKLCRSQVAAPRIRKTGRREIPTDVRRAMANSQRPSAAEAAEQNKDPETNLSSRAVRAIRQRAKER